MSCHKWDRWHYERVRRSVQRHRTTRQRSIAATGLQVGCLQPVDVWPHWEERKTGNIRLKLTPEFLSQRVQNFRRKTPSLVFFYISLEMFGFIQFFRKCLWLIKYSIEWKLNIQGYWWRDCSDKQSCVTYLLQKVPKQNHFSNKSAKCQLVAENRRLSYGFLAVPVTRTTRYGPRSFAVAGPSAWNSLPAPLRNCKLLPSFSRELTTKLFNKAYH